MSAKQNLGRQIKAAMERRGWESTGAELARRYQGKFASGISEQTANAWLKGRRVPNALHLQELGELLDASLRLDAGAKPPKHAVGETTAALYTPTQADREAWQAFLTLSPQRRELIGDLLKALAEPVKV
jgi:transcriptional regulator with XRE-family HTH domain